MKDTLEVGMLALSVFGARSQNNRLLRMEFPEEDGPRATMLVNTVHMREELSRDFLRALHEWLRGNVRLHANRWRLCLPPHGFGA